MLPKLAVWKFASCDGCQLSLLDCEDELLRIAGAVQIACFPEATSATVEGPYDLSLVEGAVSTPEDLERIRTIRANSRTLVTIGACATAGGIQALRNLADVDEWSRQVYATPEWLDVLPTCTPIADHVPVDFELRGCPIDKGQLLELLGAYLHRRQPRIPTYSVCVECKRRGNACVMVAGQPRQPCMGPVTQAGCNALCPSYDRGCFGCFGPRANADIASLTAWWRDELELPADRIRAQYQQFCAWAEPFRDAGTSTNTELDEHPRRGDHDDD